MALSARAKKLVAEITKGNLKLGDLKKRGAEIKKVHDLAMELWSTGEYYPRLLATLIFDNKLLTEMSSIGLHLICFSKTRTNAPNWLTGCWQTS